jgi:hypothetical protein
MLALNIPFRPPSRTRETVPTKLGPSRKRTDISPILHRRYSQKTSNHFFLKWTTATLNCQVQRRSSKFQRAPPVQLNADGSILADIRNVASPPHSSRTQHRYNFTPRRYHRSNHRPCRRIGQRHAPIAGAVDQNPNLDQGIKFIGIRHGGNLEGANAGLTEAPLRSLRGHKNAGTMIRYAQETPDQQREEPPGD